MLTTSLACLALLVATTLLHYEVLSLLAREGSYGALGHEAVLRLAPALYFSAETYTSLGFGDVVPDGPLRLLAGAEALNGLLLIGWSASFLYLEMERWWQPRAFKP